MLAAIVMLLTVSPVREIFPDQERAACKLWWVAKTRTCRDEDVEIIGEWDPRPNPSDWQESPSMSAPPDWGAYETEKRY